jgi:hypothetical protein
MTFYEWQIQCRGSYNVIKGRARTKSAAQVNTATGRRGRATAAHPAAKPLRGDRISATPLTTLAKALQGDRQETIHEMTRNFTKRDQEMTNEKCQMRNGKWINPFPFSPSPRIPVSRLPVSQFATLRNSPGVNVVLGAFDFDLLYCFRLPVAHVVVVRDDARAGAKLTEEFGPQLQVYIRQ